MFLTKTLPVIMYSLLYQIIAKKLMKKICVDISIFRQLFWTGGSHSLNFQNISKKISQFSYLIMVQILNRFIYLLVDRDFLKSQLRKVQLQLKKSATRSSCSLLVEKCNRTFLAEKCNRSTFYCFECNKLILEYQHLKK
jgi:hypothetical protein